MNKKLPQISHGKKICIICEGYEEYEYILKLMELGIWNEDYEFFPINAESNGKIAARYQEKYQSNSYDLVLVFCDTDNNPYEDYETIKRKINNIHGTETAADHVVMYGNPCTMQIILLHFEDIKLDSHKKEENRMPIKRLTGVAGYRARQDQRARLFATITKENYNLMKLRVEKLPNDDTIVSSSNLGIFLNDFSNKDDDWINKINQELED